MTDGRPLCELDLRSAQWAAPAQDPNVRMLLCSSEPLPCVILRATPRRRVLQTLTAPPLLIKQYFSAGGLQRMKSALRGDAAEREWRALRGAAERLLPVPRPLALGFLPDASLLVTEFITSAQALDELLRAAIEPARRRRIVRAAALLLRALHDAGYFQRDLHFGNLLGRENEERIELWLIDLQRVEIDPWRPRAKRWRDLAALHGGAAGSAADRLRFFKTYLSTDPEACRNARELALRLDGAGRRHRFRLWRSRRKRCCAENREFFAVRAGSLSGFARRSWWNAALKAALATPGGIPADAFVVKDSQTTKVASTMIGPQKLFIKRYNFQSAGYALKNLFRSCRAKRGWLAGNDCCARGVEVALPVAYLERRRWRVLQESVIVTAAIEGEELSRLLGRGALPLARRRALLGELARWLRRLHDRGLVARDLKGENIIAVSCGSARYRFYLVDFDGISRVMPRPQMRAKNLSRLARAISAGAPLNATDRLRLAHEYSGRAGGAERRKLYRRITSLSGEARAAFLPCPRRRKRSTGRAAFWI